MSTYKLRHITLFLFFFISIFSKNTCAQEYTWSLLAPAFRANTSFDDISPTIINNNLIVTRIINNAPKQYIIDADTSAIQWLWTNPFLDTTKIAFPHLHDSTLYYASPFQLSNQSYMAIYQAQGLFPPTLIETIIPSAFTSYPFLSPDGHTLFVASNRSGGNGNTDIWYFTSLDKGTWQGPYNIGEPINSPGNELSPFLPHPDTLYFASDGFGGKGKLDIFRSVREKGVWQAPLSLANINSEWDDTDFMIINDSLAAFVSDRPGGKGGYDVYFSQHVKIGNQEKPRLSLQASASAITQHIQRTENAIAFTSCIHPKDLLLEEYDRELINTLTQRLKNSPSSTVHLTTHPLTESILRDMLSQGVLPQQVQIDNDIIESMIVISGGTNALYAPIASSTSLCEPQSIDITLNAEPSGSVKQWEIRIENSFLHSGFIVPASVSIPVCMVSHESQDSLVIIAQGIDTQDNIIVDSLKLSINHSLRSSTQSALPSNTVLIWQLNDIQQMLPYVLRTLNAIQSPSKTFELIITEENEQAVLNTIAIMRANPEAKSYTFTSVVLSSESPYYSLIKRGTNRIAKEVQSGIIPIIVR